MNEAHLTELFLECFTIQELVALYRSKVYRTSISEEEEIIFYNQVIVELRDLAQQKYDELLGELAKVDGTLSKRVVSRTEHQEDGFPFHINMQEKCIRAMNTSGTKAIYRDY